MVPVSSCPVAFLIGCLEMQRRGRAALALFLTAPAAADPSCNRNGVARPDGSCQCDAAWQGSTCNSLALQPASGANLGAIYPNETTSSWGGTIQRGADRMYHLVVSEIAAGCGLGAWQRNSFIRHATSPTVDGTYTPQEVPPTPLPAPATSLATATHPGGPQCVLLHIGGGTHDESKRPVQTNCSGGYTPKSAWPADAPVPAADRLLPHLGAGPGLGLVAPVMQAFGTGHGWGSANITCAADLAGSTSCHFDNPSGWVDK
eukprot:gene2250-3122_t